MKGLAGPPAVNLAAADLNFLVFLGDRRQIQQRPSLAGLEQVVAEIVEVNALHDDGDDAFLSSNRDLSVLENHRLMASAFAIIDNENIAACARRIVWSRKDAIRRLSSRRALEGIRGV